MLRVGVPLVSAVSGVVLLGGIVVGCTSTHRSGIAATNTSDSSSSTQDVMAGFFSSMGWRIPISESELQVSNDAGKSWTDDPLPSSLPTKDLEHVTATAGGSLVVVGNVGGSAEVASQSSSRATWTAASLHVAWPSGWNLPASPPYLLPIAGPDGTEDVVAEQPLGMAEALVALFQSSDGGTSFQQIFSQTAPIWKNALFVSSTDGVVLAGPSGGVLLYTLDGGHSWLDSSLPPAVTQATFTPPILLDSQILTAAVETDAAGNRNIRLLSSSNGSSFHTVGSVLSIPTSANAGEIVFAASSGSMWVFSYGDLYQSKDSGRTWNLVSSNAPKGVEEASASSSTVLSIVVDDTVCGPQKGNACSSSKVTEESTDAGRIWSVQ